MPRKWLLLPQKLIVSIVSSVGFLVRGNQCHNLAWTTGINDRRGQSRKVREHEHALSHMAACVTYDLWQQNLIVNEQISSEFKNEVSFWSEVLPRIVDITLTLASNISAVRADRERLGEKQKLFIRYRTSWLV